MRPFSVESERNQKDNCRGVLSRDRALILRISWISLACTYSVILFILWHKFARKISVVKWFSWDRRREVDTISGPRCELHAHLGESKYQISNLPFSQLISNFQTFPLSHFHYHTFTTRPCLGNPNSNSAILTTRERIRIKLSYFDICLLRKYLHLQCQTTNMIWEVIFSPFFGKHDHDRL